MCEILLVLGSWLNVVTCKSLCDPKITSRNITDCSLWSDPGQDKFGTPVATSIDKNMSETTETVDEYPEVVVKKIETPTGLQAVDISVFDIFHWAYSVLL